MRTKNLRTVVFLELKGIDMKKVANFYKVSFDQFVKDWTSTFDKYGDFMLRKEQTMRNTYGNIMLPKRGTVGSAGYDFVSPLQFTLEPGEEIVIPTGICAEIKNGWVLMIFPRSGLGFKYYSRLANSVGIVDSDYYLSENEGHIFLKIRNDGDKTMTIQEGDKIVQGIFVHFGITFDDDATEKRNGGFGSTGR